MWKTKKEEEEKGSDNQAGREVPLMICVINSLGIFFLYN